MFISVLLPQIYIKLRNLLRLLFFVKSCMSSIKVVICCLPQKNLLPNFFYMFMFSNIFLTSGHTYLFLLWRSSPRTPTFLLVHFQVLCSFNIFLTCSHKIICSFMPDKTRSLSNLPNHCTWSQIFITNQN